MKIISKLIRMSAYTYSLVRCFIIILFTLFTSIANTVRKFTTLVNRVIIVSIFFFMCANTRLCAWSLIKSILAIIMKVTIFKRQVLTELDHFIVSSHLFDVSASRSIVTRLTWSHIIFLIENIWLIMYKMTINNFRSQICLCFIKQIAIFVLWSLGILFEIKRVAPRLIIAKLNAFIESFVINFQSWLQIKPRLNFFKPILIRGIYIQFQMMLWAFYPLAVSVTVLRIVITSGLVLCLLTIHHQSLWIWMFFLVSTAIVFSVWRFIKFFIIFTFSAAITTI